VRGGEYSGTVEILVGGGVEALDLGGVGEEGGVVY
jgi:hypothetical protein